MGCPSHCRQILTDHLKQLILLLLPNPWLQQLEDWGCIAGLIRHAMVQAVAENTHRVAKIPGYKSRSPSTTPSPRTLAGCYAINSSHCRKYSRCPRLFWAVLRSTRLIGRSSQRISDVGYSSHRTKHSPVIGSPHSPITPLSSVV